MPAAPRPLRRGSILIIIAGICALLATLAATHLLRSRTEAAESLRVVQVGQARLMFAAACCYILEAAVPVVEAAGAGASRGDQVTDPQGYFTALGNRPNPPGRLVGRFPMYSMRLPPNAASLKRVYDPDVRESQRPTRWRADPTEYAIDPETGKKADNQPAPSGVWDSAPLPGSDNLAWFRVFWLAMVPKATPDPYKSTPPAVFPDSPSAQTAAATAVFIVTCGAGATRGYRSWDEVIADNAQSLFGDEDTFRDLLANEIRYWYEVHWETLDIAELTNGPTGMVDPPQIIPPDPGPFVLPDSADLDEHLKAYYGPVPGPTTEQRNAYSLSLTTDAFRYFGQIKQTRRLLTEPIGY